MKPWLNLLSLLILGLSTSAHADLNVGSAAFQRGDYARALTEFEASAQTGDAVAEYNIGVMHESAKGVAEDLPKAMYWYGKSAKHGHMLGQFALGRMYQLGRGAPQNLVLARVWLVLASRQGDGFARQGLRELEGQITPLEREEADRLLAEMHNR